MPTPWVAPSKRFTDAHDLREYIARCIQDHGPYLDLNDLDISSLKNLSYVFRNLDFQGDVSRWDVSHVIAMDGMFHRSTFNGDLSKWDVSRVTSMMDMFAASPFNQDLSRWNVSQVRWMNSMFFKSSFNQDISGWDVSKVKSMVNMFSQSSFNQDLSAWDVSNAEDLHRIFAFSPLTHFPMWHVNPIAQTNSMFLETPLHALLQTLPGLGHEEYLTSDDLESFDYLKQKWVAHQLETQLIQVDSVTRTPKARL